ncbi:MAG: glycine--tRNA ligase [Candidatus Kerfeldbacteria bacterium]|nr:glycine--tRNA ligase [Candidatus Kerfeldbacteria bacterium]
MAGKNVGIEQIVNLSKRRGFVFPSAEIYGGLGGFWDWGPLGVLLKNNIKREFWKAFVQQRDDVVGLDGSIITNPKVWEASGHVVNFNDAMVECTKCHHRFKAGEVKKTCPDCGGKLLPPRQFNTMFKTFVGPAEDTANAAYLRPETAQNIFVNFEAVAETMRLKLPFGIAQVGKAFRNEITPGNFVFRSREFEQMELEYFVFPDDAPQAFHQWVTVCHQWFRRLGLSANHLREHRYQPDELAHYSRATTDLEYAFPIEGGWAELMGIADRTDFDLRRHGRVARGRDDAFAVADASGKKVVPYVIEPSMGVDRAALAFLLDAYQAIAGGRTTTTESIKEEEVVLKLDPRLAPYTVAVLPLSRKPELQKVALEVAATLRQQWSVSYDETGSIGKRYRRQDEIGTPWCVTVDFDTLEGAKRPKGTVTVRDRDSMEQENVAVEELEAYVGEKLK